VGSGWLWSDCGGGAEQPGQRVLCVVVCGERPEGGFVGRVGVSLAGRERDGEINFSGSCTDSFGGGGWSLVASGETNTTDRTQSR
jgi:hypothetical protein